MLSATMIFFSNFIKMFLFCPISVQVGKAKYRRKKKNEFAHYFLIYKRHLTKP